MPGTVLVVNPRSAGGRTEKDWPRLRAWMHENVALVYASQARWEEAWTRHEQAIALQREHLPPRDRELVTSLSNASDTLRHLGRLDESRAFLEEALSIGEEHLGKEHPTTISTLSRLAQAQRLAGDMEAARASLEETLAWFRSYNAANHGTTTEGFGRMDAIGRIINQAIRFTSDAKNAHQPNAPASFPLLWDAPRHDYVQWIGFAGNSGAGSLGRNWVERTDGSREAIGSC